MEEQIGNKVALVDRKHLELAGVRHVERFNEEEITLDTNMGILFLKGEGLHITRLNLENGLLTAEGFFTTMQFRGNRPALSRRKKGKNLWDRYLK